MTTGRINQITIRTIKWSKTAVLRAASNRGTSDPKLVCFFLATFSFETIVMQWVMTRTHEESLVATLVHRPDSGRVHWQCLWAQSPPPARSRCYGFSLFPRTRREKTSERPHRPSGGSLADARDPGRREGSLPPRSELSAKLFRYTSTQSVAVRPPLSLRPTRRNARPSPISEEPSRVAGGCSCTQETLPNKGCFVKAWTPTIAAPGRSLTISTRAPVGVRLYKTDRLSTMRNLGPCTCWPQTLYANHSNGPLLDSYTITVATMSSPSL